MIVHNDFIKIQSEARPTFDNVTPRVKEIVAESGVKNGNVLVYSPHTTCSVVIQEYSDGQTYYGTELIQQDLVNVLNKIIPTCTNEGQYLHPCQKHIEDAARLRGEHASWSLNTDAHLRSVIMGRSVTVPIIDGEVQLGEFGYIWFADFDQVRARERKAIVQVMGI
ncbi:MAG: YjbQ family protein [Oscillospiraceae bacterium]|jgi:secondary thiamine-phosphate synthase enzyme|nr:YjbQ family protein [Oscillospiraceae bacterium]